MWLIETKGWEDKDVPQKDARAEDWCKTVTDLTGVKWSYLKVPDIKYRNLTNNFTKQPCKTLAEILVTFWDRGRIFIESIFLDNFNVNIKIFFY
jgi:type III restriction enzyme